jgi:hypothetical protein
VVGFVESEWSGLRATDGNRASSGDEAGRHASPYDDLLPTRRCRYATKSVFAAILQDERDRTGQALQRRRLRLALAIRPRDLRAVGDIPSSSRISSPTFIQIKSDPIFLDTVSTTMTAAKEVDDERIKAEADSWQ